jgi:UDP-2-acetamido-3-amino-2,3-dideoxy-glucuronate N-acetyltransferase
MSHNPAMAGLATVRIHPSAEVAESATIGLGTHVWHGCQVREHAVIGAECILAKNVYIDAGVRVGCRVKIQNNVSLFHGVTLEDGVFVGPHACFTNDKTPRAINPDGTRKGASDWVVAPTLVRYGASIGAGAVIVCGVTIGRFAMIAAGAVVTRDVRDHGLVAGVPARLIGLVCACGERLADDAPAGQAVCCARCLREC